MIGWKRLYPKPAGSLPGGIVTQWGVALITVLILIFVALWLASGGTEQAGIDSIGGEVTGPARSFAGQMAAQVEAETRRAAAERTLQAQQRQEARESTTGAIGGGQVTMDEALLLAGPSPETGRAYTQQEFELRERLRLEALERRSRSLRSSPVAQTYRQLDRARSPTEAGAEPGPVEAIRAEASAALSQALGTFQGVTGSLEDEIAAEAESDQAFLAALTGAQQGADPDPAQAVPPGPAAPAAPAPNSLGFPGAAAQPARDYANPPRLEGGDDPPGWERIYEGAFLEAVLVTQLSGDFPGPVLAQVAVPFYSADRQRVLVPRGARVIGTASAVQGQDQERLAVSFHRLIYPDGRWVTLDFHGLNQVGEGALKDRVNRHYFSMFAAVGAVGIISGLTLQNSNPYGGGARGVPGRSRARARPSGGANLAAFLEPFTQYHNPGRASAPYLVYVRCTGPAKPERRMKMKHRIVSGLVLVPLMIVLSTTPAYAIFGSIIAAIQRAQMIVNQGVQIYNDAMEKITMNGQLTELTDQFSHLKEQALGTVGALTQPFTDLSSIPTEFIGVGLSWKNDFTGVAGELAGAVEQLGESGTSFTDAWRDRLTASNTISESDFLSLYAGQSAEVGAAASRVYLAAAEAGDKKLVMAHAQSDAAKNLMVAAKEAVSSYEGLRNNTNTSNTALQQAMVAGTVTQGNLTAAMAQLMVYRASQESAREYEQEIARREELARFVEAEREAQIAFDAQQAGIAARVDSMREGLLFRVPALYGGPGQ